MSFPQGHASENPIEELKAKNSVWSVEENIKDNCFNTLCLETQHWQFGSDKKFTLQEFRNDRNKEKWSFAFFPPIEYTEVWIYQ